MGDYQRWQELNRKCNNGTITDEEYQEMLNLENEDIRESLLSMREIGM